LIHPATASGTLFFIKKGNNGYAMTWVDPVEVIRNEDDYTAYDDYDGNCNNFISQCLVAGGIPMDYFGDVFSIPGVFVRLINNESIARQYGLRY